MLVIILLESIKEIWKTCLYFNAIHEFTGKVKLFDLEYEIDGIKKSGIYSFLLLLIQVEWVE